MTYFVIGAIVAVMDELFFRSYRKAEFIVSRIYSKDLPHEEYKKFRQICMLARRSTFLFVAKLLFIILTWPLSVIGTPAVLRDYKRVRKGLPVG